MSVSLSRASLLRLKALISLSTTLLCCGAAHAQGWHFTISAPTFLSGTNGGNNGSQSGTSVVAQGAVVVPSNGIANADFLVTGTYTGTTPTPVEITSQTLLFDGEYSAVADSIGDPFESALIQGGEEWESISSGSKTFTPSSGSFSTLVSIGTLEASPTAGLQYSINVSAAS